jgi:hypothetical protein
MELNEVLKSMQTLHTRIDETPVGPDLDALMGEITTAAHAALTVFIRRTQSASKNTDTDANAEESVQLNEVCARVYLACISVMSKMRGIEETELRTLPRKTVLQALNIIRDWLIANVDETDSLHIARKYILAFEFDYRTGIMTENEPVSWCKLLAAVVNGLMRHGTAVGCTYMVRICDEVGYEIEGFGDEEKEQLAHLEFVEIFQDDVQRILAFMADNGVTVNDKMCIIENQPYARHFQLVRKSKNPAKYKGKVRDVTPNGSRTDRNVYYDPRWEALYIKISDRKYPVIPESFSVTITRHMAMNSDIIGDATESEIADAEVMRDRIRAEQNTLEDPEDIPGEVEYL